MNENIIFGLIITGLLFCCCTISELILDGNTCCCNDNLEIIEDIEYSINV
jgi:hypothetical protein